MQLSNRLVLRWTILSPRTENPCKEYWYDITSDREKRKIEKYYAIKEIPATYLHLEHGNRLLASMGTLGKDFLSFLGEFDCELYEQF